MEASVLTDSPQDVPEAAEAAPQSDAAQPAPAPAPPHQPTGNLRVIAFMNQKGGVGKTTTTVTLGAALANLGRRVMVVDLDPQAHLTLHLGIDPDQLDNTIYDLLTDDDLPLRDILQPVPDIGAKGGSLTVVPATVSLAGVETELAPRMVTGQAQRILRNKFDALTRADPTWDYILIDCPPSLGLLTINALTLAREVIVPMQPHFLALQGLSKLLETVELIHQGFNTDLRVTGMVLCMHEGQTLLANEVVADLKTFLDASRAMNVPWNRAIVYDPPVRRNIKLAESPSFGQTVFEYAPGSNGAKDYRRLARSVDQGHELTEESIRRAIGQEADREAQAASPAPEGEAGPQPTASRLSESDDAAAETPDDGDNHPPANDPSLEHESATRSQ